MNLEFDELSKDLRTVKETRLEKTMLVILLGK